MSNWFEFLSGNVPGGFYLYLLVTVVIVLILVFMHRVNELFTRKHLMRWLIVSLTFISAVYIFIWLKKPPHFLYKRYTVAIFQSNTSNNWLGEYLTDISSKTIKPYKKRREYFFPYHWLYRMNPADSISDPRFVQEVYKKIPVHTVLDGSIVQDKNHIDVELTLYQNPSGKIIKNSGGKFNLNSIEDYLVWLKMEFSEFLPFEEIDKKTVTDLHDSLFVLMKRKFYKRKYEDCNLLLNKIDMNLYENSTLVNWQNYIKIKLAGSKRLEDDLDNPYGKEIPAWQKELQEARNSLLKNLRSNPNNVQSNLMAAEAYIWEEKFSPAEIFLERLYVENPFQIDVLLNLTFLHSSRYQEFGFNNVQEIYQQILEICPVEEAVLLKWSDLIIAGNPSYTPPPEFAKKFVSRYLSINPYSWKGWLMLGKLYAQQGNRETALLAYLNADSLNSGNGLINYNLGVLFYEWMKYDEAKEYFNKAIKYDDFLDAHLYLGAIYKEEGLFRNALEQFRYRVEHKTGEDDFYAFQAMKGIRECLDSLKQPLK